jgi:alkanesulfonate monooxygenase SsuD/methylene tetrahydromethanopterin reductase-like flavin-dependent oxidoreductase (luciferase family)
VRLGLVLEPAPGADGLASLAAQATAAEDAGLALGYLPAGEQAALLAAAAVAASTTVLRLAAGERVGTHPLELAESAAVADNVSNGRLILVLEGGDGEAGLLEETTAAVLAAIAPRPFRHAGARWSIPANLPENEDHEERIVLRPPVVQAELPVWLAGPDAPAVARRFGLAHVGADGWAETEAALGDAAVRLRRPAILALATDQDGRFEAGDLVGRLREQRVAYGLDTAIVRLPANLGDAERARAIDRLATHVAPRVAMHALPRGLESHWNATLA